MPAGQGLREKPFRPFLRPVDQSALAASPTTLTWIRLESPGR